MTQTYKAVYENGTIQLPANLRLPEHTKVYIVAPELEAGRTHPVRSPRLVHREQAADFVLEMIEEEQQ